MGRSQTSAYGSSRVSFATSPCSLINRYCSLNDVYVFPVTNRPTGAGLGRKIRRFRRCDVVKGRFRDTHRAIFPDSRESKRRSPTTTHTAIYRSEEHTSELQSLMRISYAVFCLKKKNKQQQNKLTN